MNIEVGKRYRTRDGHEARIYAIDGFPADHEIQGAIATANGWESTCWYANGDFARDGAYDEDIISEWKDPPIKGTRTYYAILWDNKELTCSGIPTRIGYMCGKDTVIGVRKITVEVTEGEGMG